MLTIDMHLDLSYNAIPLNRDVTAPVAAIRASEAGLTEKGRGRNTVSLPELRRGEVALSSFTLIARVQPQPGSNIDFRTPEIAHATTRGQLAYYRQLEEDGLIRMIADRAALERHLADWERDPAATPLGYVLSMEGADPIVAPEHLPRWHADGLRILSLVHYGHRRYASGTGAPGPIAELGRRMLRAMDELGMILDLTHLSDEGFWDCARAFEGPVLASHTNCRALVPGDRQFTDEQIRFVVERDGVIGAAFDNWMLYPGYDAATTPRELISLADVVDHVDHVCQLAGNARHTGIGSDLDGGFGTEESPRELDTIADLQLIPDLLRQRGYAEPDIAAIFHGNWLRLLRRALPH